MARRSLRLVLKFGSGILSNPEGNTLDRRQFDRLGREVAELMEAGHECLIVSSAAVAAGLSALGLKERPARLSDRQACAAVGQSLLMQRYASVFARHGLTVAQLLLTHSDLDSRKRHDNARNTLERLFEGRIVPVVNENDSVAVEELNFGDNDRLSAEVAVLVEADQLIILTGVDGLLNADGRVVPLVKDIDAVAPLVRGDVGRLSTGGMVTKLQAARAAVAAGIPVWIANGRKPGLLAAIVAGQKIGTRFPAKRG